MRRCIPFPGKALPSHSKACVICCTSGVSVAHKTTPNPHDHCGYCHTYSCILHSVSLFVNFFGGGKHWFIHPNAYKCSTHRCIGRICAFQRRVHVHCCKTCLDLLVSRDNFEKVLMQGLDVAHLPYQCSLSTTQKKLLKQVFSLLSPLWIAQ